MRSWLLAKLCFANVVSMMALFVSIGGIGYAAVTLPKNSVGAKQIKTNAVSRSEIKRSAVSTDEVKDRGLTGLDARDGSFTGADLSDATVALADLAPNSVDGSKVVNESLGGDDVAPGSLGGGDVAAGSLDGSDVAAGTFLGGKVTTQYQIAAAPLGETATGQGTSYDVHCPAGQTAIGGGGRGDATDSEFTVVHSSRPITSTTNASPPVDNGTFTGWRITVTNPVGDLPQDAAAPGPADGDILPEVWVICAALP